MIKRVNKLTALLVAATSVASIAPMTSASAATKLETLEAAMDSVQAFDGGKYIFDGYRTDDQDSATYYFNGSKDIEVEDVNGDSFVKYGKDSLSFNNTDETLLNLSTGKVDEDTANDKIAYMQTKFNSSVIKRAKKYTNDSAKIYDITAKNQLNADQFGDVWYGYETTTDATVVAANATGIYTGYVSVEGKYIDATETANVTFYYKKKDATQATKVTFDEMDEKKDGFELVAGETLFADSDNIYRVINVVESSTNAVKQTYIQKLSKAQGETVDGAYIPKTVTSYEVSADTLKEIKRVAAAADSTVRVVNGSIYAVEFKAAKDEITVKKYDLTKDRDDSEDAITNDRVYTVKEDEDFDNIKNEDAYDYDIDVNGNIWVIYKGEVQKVVKGELTTMYTVDRTMNEISVYDDNDVVVWNAKDEIFATVAGKDVAADEENKEDDKVEVVAGWVKNTDGTWSYNKADGTKATGWLNLNGTWYYLNNNGVMQTGWLNLSGTWYYLQSSGAMATGWANVNGTWYYMQSSGAMKTGWLNLSGTWYYLQSSGAMKTGWLNDNGTWYYLNSNGSMAVNTTVGGYKLGSNGAWIR